MFSKGLAEIVLIVDDVERSARFYGEVVGLAPEAPAGNGWAWFWAGEPGRAQRLALPAGERWGKVHFAFDIPHEILEAAVDHVRGNGVEVYGPTYFDWMRATSYYFYDPDGNLLEFWAPAPENTAKETK